ncbi:MBL fold metallo-hydrolase [Candidatus Woesearchaeota archaeon]|nr:MBL fold metallo-hydrolase [Candidatus Woesearchaeota archaeon]
MLQVIQFATKGYDNNFSYLIYDEQSKEAIIVDPCGNIQLIEKEIEKKNLQLNYIINTHSHFDHIEKNKEIKTSYNCKILMHENEKYSEEKIDKKLKHNEIITLGNFHIRILNTPGHTKGSICLFFENKQHKYLITGDTLFINTIGRIDLEEGNKLAMYDSLYNKILQLDENTIILPGHDYGSMPSDTLKNQKKSNPFLKCKSKEEFMKMF